MAKKRTDRKHTTKNKTANPLSKTYTETLLIYINHQRLQHDPTYHNLKTTSVSEIVISI